jgi:ribonuclease HI
MHAIPDSFIYTDGSQKPGNSTLGASIVNPRTQTTTHIGVKSEQERHTINKSELASITVVLELYSHSPQIQTFTDSAFGINKLRNYAIDPLNYTHHPHRELLHYTTPTSS